VKFFCVKERGGKECVSKDGQGEEMKGRLSKEEGSLHLEESREKEGGKKKGGPKKAIRPEYRRERVD